MTSEAEMTGAADTAANSVPETSVSRDEMGAGNSPDDDGPRMMRLRQVLQKTTEKCVSSLKFSVLSDHYKFTHETLREDLQKVMAELKREMDTKIKDELEEMLREGNLLPLLNDLDKRQIGTEDSTPAWRPSGSPAADVRDHLHKTKLEEKARLEKVLQAAEQETEKLCKMVERRKKRLSDTQEKLEEKVEFIERAYQACALIPSAEEVAEVFPEAIAESESRGSNPGGQASK